jgi:hypothetical protein
MKQLEGRSPRLLERTLKAIKSLFDQPTGLQPLSYFLHIGVHTATTKFLKSIGFVTLMRGLMGFE